MSYVLHIEEGVVDEIVARLGAELVMREDEARALGLWPADPAAAPCDGEDVFDEDEDEGDG